MRTWNFFSPFNENFPSHFLLSRSKEILAPLLRLLTFKFTRLLLLNALRALYFLS